MAESFATIAALFSAFQLLLFVAWWTNYKYGVSYDRALGDDAFPFYRWSSLRWWKLITKQSVIFLAVCSVSINVLNIVGRENLTEPNLPTWLFCLAGIYLAISVISKLTCLRLELGTKVLRKQEQSTQKTSQDIAS